jgi:hypothetical protein
MRLVAAIFCGRAELAAAAVGDNASVLSGRVVPVEFSIKLRILVAYHK